MCCNASGASEKVFGENPSGVSREEDDGENLARVSREGLKSPDSITWWIGLKSPPMASLDVAEGLEAPIVALN
jgi:hypothetical protein